ncbi:multicopper oxidase family protein [Anaeromyxobacter paludicola]|nr:multicopper oxidase domain-containing protein [Anaeromyxobacter paludicola]
MTLSTRALPLLLAAAAVGLWGCGGSSAPATTTQGGTVAGDGGTPRLDQRPLDPEAIGQFLVPLPIIPVRQPDTTTTPGSDRYVVTAVQGVHDFGLRRFDGSAFLDPVTGKPVKTTSWGYDTSYLGPTIEARSGRPVVVTYVNGLVDAAGAPLAHHLFPVDHTIDGAGWDVPEIRLVPHLHGGHVAAEFDGNPLFWFSNDPKAAANGMGGPAGDRVQYTYDNSQEAATLWFHDHAMGVTRLNVYAGLASYYLLRDDAEAALGLPSGAYEVPLVLQDKSFNDDGSLSYASYPLYSTYTHGPLLDPKGNPMYSSGPETYGNTVVVNGVVWPYLEVEPRKYRFRLLNGADSRFFNLWLEVAGQGPQPGLQLVQIGAESGLLPAAVPLGDGPDDRGLLLANGERADVIIDFSGFAGKTIVLRNDAAAPYPMGDPANFNANTVGKVMQFRVTKPLAGADTSAVPAAPRAHAPLPEPDGTRIVDLQELSDVYDLYDPTQAPSAIPRHELRLNGLRFMDPITELPRLGTVEDWYIVNTTVDMHPIHLHLVAYEVVEKGAFDPLAYRPAAGGDMGVMAPNGFQKDTDPEGKHPADPGFDAAYAVAPTEAGLKDTVRVPPGGYVRIRARFDRKGVYMWHCHILAHEEHSMMRPFEVVAP